MLLGIRLVQVVKQSVIDYHINKMLEDDIIMLIDSPLQH